MSVQFVNVDPKTGKFWNASQTQQQILDMAAQKRDPLMDEFVSELEKLWIRTGVRDVCKRCVAGEFLYMGKNGCCGGCPNVSTQGCIAKPMRCATFLCSTGHMYDKLLTLPGLDKLRWEMDKILSFAFNGTQWDQKTGQLNYSDNIYHGSMYFFQAYDSEAKAKLSPKQKSTLRKLIRMVKSFEVKSGQTVS